MDDSFTHLPLRRIPSQGRSRDKVLRALLAAERILDEEGPAALNVTRVAAAAGLSVGALHQYLPDRETITATLAARYHARLEALLDQVIEAPVTQDPVGAVLEGVAQVYRDEAAARTLRLQQLGSEESYAHKRRMGDKLARAFVAHGLVPEAQASVTAQVVFLAADSVLHEAFRVDPAGDRALLEALSNMLRGYLEQDRPPADGGAG